MKIFLDCGTNLGQGLTEFEKKFKMINQSEWKIYCFEPNPDIKLKSLFPNASNIEYIQKAIWKENTQLEFRMQGKTDDDLKGLGSKLEIVDKKYNPNNCKFKIQQVEAIDLSDFITDLINKDINTEIYMKMDIEGAEFEVLQHLIERDTIKYIKEIFCECHARFRFPHEKQNQRDVKERIKEIENNLKDDVEKHDVKFHFWI